MRPPGLARRVEQAGGRDGLPGPQVAEARVGRVVPEDAVAAAGDEEGHDHGRVALPEVEVVALEVEKAQLLLSETVERLAVVFGPLLPHVERPLSLHVRGLERPSAVPLSEHHLAPRVEERDCAGPEIHPDLHLRRGESRPSPGVGTLDTNGLAATQARGEARPAEERGVAGVGHAHDVLGAEGNLQLTAGDRQIEDGGALRAGRQGGGRQHGQRDAECEQGGDLVHGSLRKAGGARMGEGEARRRGSRTPHGCARPPWPGSRRRRRGRGGRRGLPARRRSPRHPGSR